MEELSKTWAEQEPHFRRDWKRRYGHMGLQWEEIRDAYLFGWSASQQPEFAEFSWEQAESDLAQHWYNPQLATEESAWDYVREAVEAGWRKGREALRRKRRAA
ncbi:MAG: hypothetical protein M1343_06610 [Chloroflexi bacterium]|nr:hypothetical protein [Chloroflexota bacterium]MDA8187788.1 hypothetical protein [Dehalococcoidales bacterium]